MYCTQSNEIIVGVIVPIITLIVTICMFIDREKLSQTLAKYDVNVQNWVDGLKQTNSEFEALAKQYHDEVTELPD
jgi:hypothetical protein